MWAIESFSIPKYLPKDLHMLGMIAHLYLLYKKGISDKELVQEIYSLYHSQLCDGSLQELFVSIIPLLHHPDDFITAFENRSLSGLGMATLIWKWLSSISSSLYHFLQETKELEEDLFHLILLFFALCTAQNFSCLEDDFWRWASPSGRDFVSLFPNFLSNYFYWKNFHNNKLHWEGCKNSFAKFLILFPKQSEKNSALSSIYDNLQKKFEEMSEMPHHWPKGPNGWPSPIQGSSHGGKWIEEMKNQLLFYLSLDNGFSTACHNVESSSILYNYINDLFSLFSPTLTVKNLKNIVLKLENFPHIFETKDPFSERLISALLSWKSHFLHATSFSVTYFDPKKRLSYTGQVSEPLAFSLFHPDKVDVTLFSDKGGGYSTTLSFLFTKELSFHGLPVPPPIIATQNCV